MNLPSGRVFVFPKEETMNGKIVIDGSWEGAIVDEPIVMEIENGVVTNISESGFTEEINSTFDELSKSLNKNKEAIVKTVEEFGFGMNPEAKLIGNVLEDEKQLGTCYFSIGDNSNLGGTANVGIHVSGVLLSPSVWLEDNQILENGLFLLEN